MTKYSVTAYGIPRAQIGTPEMDRRVALVEAKLTAATGWTVELLQIDTSCDHVDGIPESARSGFWWQARMHTHCEYKNPAWDAFDLWNMNERPQEWPSPEAAGEAYLRALADWKAAGRPLVERFQKMAATAEASW